MSEKITYNYRNHKYTFVGERIYPAADKKSFGKWIYMGEFVGGNPHPDKLVPGKKYVLVHITVNEKDLKSSLPQCRQYWDAAYFEGEHLREVLGRDDAALELATRLNDGEEAYAGEYMFVEPVYAQLVDRGKPSSKLIPYIDVADLTSDERLEVLEQGCCAVDELYRHCAKNSPIISHRDYKLGNMMLEIGASIHVRLIDFASIRSEAGDGTWMETITSPSNTTPEAVGVFSGQKEATGFTVSRKTDVFAMAGIVAQLFGSCNPILKWNEKQSKSGKYDEAVIELREAYECALLKYRSVGAHTSWLEQELDFEFCWDDDASEDVKALFRAMIHITPDDRLPLEEVYKRVKAMRKPSNAAGQKRTVYLVDRNKLSAHLRSYTVAMKRAWAEGRPGEKAFVGAFGTARSAVPTAEELRWKQIPNCPSAADLCAKLGKIPGVEEGHSLLALTLQELYARGVFDENFSGTIHIFAPSGDGVCHGVPGYDLPAVANMLRARGAEIVLHSDTPYTGETPWYDRWEELLQTGIVKEGDTACVVDDGAGYVPPRDIQTGAGGLYIKRGETKIYVARRV